jgi:hypothetical protein
MTANLPDRSLRRMVAQLKRLPDPDFGDIIDRLDDRQKARVLALVSDFDGRTDAEAEPAPSSAMIANVVIPEQISPWLAARINGRADSGEETADPFTLTPAAQAALRRCAATMVPPRPDQRRSPSLVSRLWARL